MSTQNSGTFVWFIEGEGGPPVYNAANGWMSWNLVGLLEPASKKAAALSPVLAAIQQEVVLCS